MGVAGVGQHDAYGHPGGGHALDDGDEGSGRVEVTRRHLRPAHQLGHRAWFDNERRLRTLVRELEALGVALVEADTRTPKRRSATPTPEPTPKTPRSRRR
jgi:hypothetical protein